MCKQEQLQYLCQNSYLDLTVCLIDTNHISQETGGDGEQQQLLSAPEAVEAEGQRVHGGEDFLQPLMT